MVRVEMGACGPGGGGIYLPGGGAVLLQNSIVAANSDNSSYLPAPNCKGNLQSKGYNLFGVTAQCGISGTLTGNLLNTNPLLGPLRDNGGATWTHALLPGSPAVDSADPLICLPTDQRGVSRPKNGNGLQFAWCDIGAYEYNGPTILRLFLPLIKR